MITKCLWGPRAKEAKMKEPTKATWLHKSIEWEVLDEGDSQEKKDSQEKCLEFSEEHMLCRFSFEWMDLQEVFNSKRVWFHSWKKNRRQSTSVQVIDIRYE